MKLLPGAMMMMAALLAGSCGISQTNDPAAFNQNLHDQQDAPKQAGPEQVTAPGDRGSVLHQVSLNYAASSDPKSRSYKIGPLDVLDITVFKVPELSKTIQISEEGTMNFPLAGEVPVGGKSAREVEQLLTKLLAVKYLQHPQITVLVKEHNSQRVTVEGAVKKPGVIPMAGGLSLLQAIALAGGFEAEVADTDVAVFRTEDGKRYAARYDVASIRTGRAADPQLQSGDVIIVPTSDLKQGFNTFLKLLPLATLAPLL
jgi:polysaccharide export outer membrane protein